MLGTARIGGYGVKIYDNGAVEVGCQYYDRDSVLKVIEHVEKLGLSSKPIKVGGLRVSCDEGYLVAGDAEIEMNDALALEKILLPQVAELVRSAASVKPSMVMGKRIFKDGSEFTFDHEPISAKNLSLIVKLIKRKLKIKDAPKPAAKKARKPKTPTKRARK